MEKLFNFWEIFFRAFCLKDNCIGIKMKIFKKKQIRPFGSINLYFSSLKLSDSFLSIFYALCAFFGLSVSRTGRKRLLQFVRDDFNAKACFLYGSGRSSLYSILKALNLGRGSEVLVTGFTCVVVPHAIMQLGLKPIFVDIDLKTYGMDPNLVEKYITQKTKVIIIQHTFGIPADIENLLKIGRKNNLYVIEDCAVSLYSRYKGRLTGTFGDAAFFSFELSKTITSEMGGLLLVNSNRYDVINKLHKEYDSLPELRKISKTRLLLQLGLSGVLYRPVMYRLFNYLIAILFKIKIFKMSISPKETQAKMPQNYRVKLSNEQAVILARQWKCLDKLSNHSKELAFFYYQQLQKTSYVSFPVQELDERVLIRYPVLTRCQDALTHFFYQKNIELGRWFGAPLGSPNIDHLLFGYHSGDCPNAEHCAANIVNLPLNCRIDNNMATYIIKLLLSFTEQ